ncbi:Ribosome production factor 1 [Entomophthora muscae]|uniref:Ribosome production factor 1 n=1 Tax=Entomophthora muscae TaxID=34485 RepID=A0ACC2TZ75_9FUNG|nr:Ribosome production factor 1 [Entomophthora muscae]
MRKRKERLGKIRNKEEKADPSLKEKRLAEFVPQTLESKREFDETFVDEDDEQIKQEDAEDEYGDYFKKEVTPKVMITTSKNASDKLFAFADELVDIVPDSHFIRRGYQFEISHIMEFGKKREFTDVIIIGEDAQKPNSITLIHLPNGPTAYFKLSGIVLSKQIYGHGRSSAHQPELILNNFSTRLGHLVGRMFHSLFPPVPEFQGRQVATFHNQRDFIFFRRHRYAFRSGEKADLQELGPRFTLKLKWLQRGLYDPNNGEYEWKHKTDMETTRRRFFL